LIVSVEQGLVAYLSADAGLSALIGDRIQPQVIYQDDQKARTPAIVYSRIGGEENWTNSGPSGLSNALIALDCIDYDYGTAKAVSEKVRACLGKFLRGFLPVGPNPPGNGYHVQGLLLSDSADVPPSVMPEIQELGVKITRRIATIWFEESASTT
jgi:hypothetical protein